jgi:hypothetical protein
MSKSFGLTFNLLDHHRRNSPYPHVLGTFIWCAGLEILIATFHKPQSSSKAESLTVMNTIYPALAKELKEHPFSR